MRLTLLAASALAFAACSESKPAEPAAAAPAPEAAAPAHDMSAMDDAMKSADASDDANTAETADGFTFHTIGGKVESVHLPTAAGVTWTASTTDTDYVQIGEAKDETMPDGSMHHVVKVTPLKSTAGAIVKFEKRQGDATTPVIETRNITFMVH